MRQRFGSWMLSIPLLVACAPEDEAVSGQALALTAQGNVERALRGLYDAGSFVADSASLAEILSPIAAGDASCVDVAPTCPVGQVCQPVESDCEPEEVTVADLQDGREDVKEAIDELVDTLRERIFTDANLESEDAESATYLLGPDVLCQNDDSPSVPAPGGSPPPVGDDAPDAECVEQAQKLQIRLRLTAPSNGDIDVELLLSAARRNPATLELHDDHVGLVVDLGEVKGTLDALGEDTGELEAMSGTLALEILRYAALDYGLRFSVRTPLHVGLLHDDGQPINVSLAASVPTAELRLDGNARQVTGTYKLGSLGVIAPLDAFRDNDEDGEVPTPAPGVPNPAPQPEPPELPWTGTIDAFLAGIDGSVTLDGSADELDFVNLGFGNASSTVKHDGTLIAQLDVNPDAGRHFDLKVAQPGDGDPTLTFSPTFDLRVLLNFASLASQLEDLPGYALNDTLRVFFDGSEPSIRPLSATDQLQVVSGTLNLTSTSQPASNLVVPAGSCLVEVDSDSPVAHELLGQFAVSNCQ
jgi:hypothetical protein